MSDEEYMNLAIKEAEKALRHDEVPVGAIIVLDGKIIGRGYNLKEKMADVTSHAEIMAIRKASLKLKDWRLNGAVMYVTMTPCSMCASAIIQSRISKIVIGAINPDLKNQEIVDFIFDSASSKPLIQVETKVLEMKCSQLLKNFFNLKREKK